MKLGRFSIAVFLSHMRVRTCYPCACANSMHDGRRTKVSDRSCMASPRDWIRLRRASPASSGWKLFRRPWLRSAPARHLCHRRDARPACSCSTTAARTVQSHLGRAITVHPDEVHDGRAGTDSGFRYRIAYIEPRLIQAALGDKPPPAALRSAGTTDDARLIAAILPASAGSRRTTGGPAARPDHRRGSQQHWPHLIGPTRQHHRSGEPSGGLAWRATSSTPTSNAWSPPNSSKPSLASTASPWRDTFARASAPVPIAIRPCGASIAPDTCCKHGASLAEAAATSGFADQSHMTRQFKKAYGLSPGRWQRATSLLKVGPLSPMETP